MDGWEEEWEEEKVVEKVATGGGKSAVEQRVLPKGNNQPANDATVGHGALSAAALHASHSSFRRDKYTCPFRQCVSSLEHLSLDPVSVVVGDTRPRREQRHVRAERRSPRKLLTVESSNPGSESHFYRRAIGDRFAMDMMVLTNTPRRVRMRRTRRKSIVSDVDRKGCQTSGDKRRPSAVR